MADVQLLIDIAALLQPLRQIPPFMAKKVQCETSHSSIFALDLVAIETI
jgi:hypothetical protein